MCSNGDSKNASLTDKKIFVVEGHPVTRKGLVQVISGEPGLEVTGEADDYHQAISLIRKDIPDLVIISLSLRNSSGIELLHNLRIYFPELLILVFSMYDENEYAERVLRSGARGYLMKDAPPENLVAAIKHILGGHVYVSEDISARILDNISKGIDNSGNPVSVLSDRELEIFRLIGEGYTTRRIARKLNISIRTAENHRAHIKEKMDFESSIELVQKATIWVHRPD